MSIASLRRKPATWVGRAQRADGAHAGTSHVGAALAGRGSARTKISS